MHVSVHVGLIDKIVGFFHRLEAETPTKNVCIRGSHRAFSQDMKHLVEVALFLQLGTLIDQVNSALGQLPCSFNKKRYIHLT
jgi:hypothetical protein